MVKLLLTTQDFPPKYQILKDKKKYYQSLINFMGRKNEIRNASSNLGKLQKWTRIYTGMLFLNRVKEFSYLKDLTTSRDLANAYHEFCDAMKLKTTRTVYLLAAEVILDHDFTPNGLSKDEAKELAKNYIEAAFTKSKGSNSTHKDFLHPIPTMVIKHARPAHINEVGVTEESFQARQAVNNNESTSPSLEFFEEQEGFTSPLMAPEFLEEEQEYPNPSPIGSDFLEEEDSLNDYDYANLVIPQRQDDERLPIRNYIMNKVDTLQESYTIGNKKFKRQNVAGTGMRCFFNSMGVDALGQTELLSFFYSDPILRYMIANEIVSAASQPEQIPTQVKNAINYDLYAFQRKDLDKLDIERSKLLRSQNSNPNLQDLAQLPAIYQDLSELGEKYLENLRLRAVTLEAYKAFIKYHIGNEEMMVALLDMEENGNSNFTSIDAIAYINDIGIKIYQPSSDNTLRLAHKYIPENATEVAYLYHHGIHFQALVFVEDKEEFDVQMSDQEQEDDDSFSEESIFSDMPTLQELRKKYPKVNMPIHYEKRYRSDDVRQIIHASKILKKKHKEIAKVFDLDARRISEILLANGIRELHYLSPDQYDILARACLQYYSEIKGSKISYAQIAKSLTNQFEVPVNTITSILWEKFKKYQEKETPDLIEGNSKKVVNLYKGKKTILEIQQATNLSIETIIKIIHENVSKDKYVNPINLEIKVKSLSKKEQESLILEAFNKLKKKNASANKLPTVSGVKRELEKYKIGYKPIERILKENGLIPNKIKSQHLPYDIQKKIKEECNIAKPQYGEIEKVYTEIGKKYGATLFQVREIAAKDLSMSQKQKNHDKVVEEYHKLTADQKRSPAGFIAKKLELSTSAINDILKKAGLCEFNGKKGINARNLLVDKTDSQKTTEQGKKRKRKEVEDNSSEEEMKPAKKKFRKEGK